LEWRRLIVAHGISGIQVYDTRLVAAMQVHGVPRILTFNDRDFARYDGVDAVHPLTIR
jgi:predicted nucleic acid-binding protein